MAGTSSYTGFQKGVAGVDANMNWGYTLPNFSFLSGGALADNYGGPDLNPFTHDAPSNEPGPASAPPADNIPTITVTGHQDPVSPPDNSGGVQIPEPNFNPVDHTGDPGSVNVPPVTIDSSLLGKLQAKIDEVKGTISDPEKLFAYVLKSVTGISKGEDGAWHFDPFAALGTAANFMTGGAASLASGVGAIDAIANALDIKTPNFNLTEPIKSPQPGDSLTQNAAGEFVPKDPYTTDAQGNQIPDTRQYTVIPQIGAGGKVESVLVGKNDGSGVLALTPDDLAKYGIDSGNINNYDFGSFFPKDGSTTPPDPQHGAPDSQNRYPGDPGYTNPQTSGTIKPQDPTDNGIAPIQGQTPGTSGLPGAAGAGGGVETNPDGGGAKDPPNTPVIVNPPPARLIPSFQNFDMPDFKILPNDFGHPIIQIATDHGAQAPTRDDLVLPAPGDKVMKTPDDSKKVVIA